MQVVFNLFVLLAVVCFDLLCFCLVVCLFSFVLGLFDYVSGCFSVYCFVWIRVLWVVWFG